MKVERETQQETEQGTQQKKKKETVDWTKELFLNAKVFLHLFQSVVPSKAYSNEQEVFKAYQLLSESCLEHCHEYLRRRFAQYGTEECSWCSGRNTHRVSVLTVIRNGILDDIPAENIEIEVENIHVIFLCPTCDAVFKETGSKNRTILRTQKHIPTFYIQEDQTLLEELVLDQGQGQQGQEAPQPYRSLLADFEAREISAHAICPADPSSQIDTAPPGLVNMRFETVFDGGFACVRCFYPHCDAYFPANKYDNIYSHFKIDHKSWKTDTCTNWRTRMQHYCEKVMREYPDMLEPKQSRKRKKNVELYPLMTLSGITVPFGE